MTDGGLLGIEFFRQLILKLESINRLVTRVIYILTNSRRKVCSIIVARNLYCLIGLGLDSDISGFSLLLVVSKLDILLH